MAMLIMTCHKQAIKMKNTYYDAKYVCRKRKGYQEMAAYFGC
jgi:hypothetical protein